MTFPNNRAYRDVAIIPAPNPIDAYINCPIRTIMPTINICSIETKKVDSIIFIDNFNIFLV